ncbi:B12 binding domain protein [Marvinbryantia formatexigens DSM 14469]|uniref:B12 binding domain protein n=1 Tax=Marvinbryantia formatexigens DSM 14469 TaxID=478749 RepID=C6LIG3_9FIRM|nr:corrinoid protein [Marvinbryantia formatexigens]EET59545.1 B12 binding domain protein [Marvinbryantia formatexigens DSM 14469]UWO26336.1 corrinoid protein [Marvinbryantia formatexigens DSM 14469]SDG07140.1 methyltransferase cognate corrinoid proteins [Marvinbryantia formatexigens]
MAGIQEVYELVVKGKAKKVAPAVEAALEEGCEPVAILNEGMIAAMDEVGAKFKNGEIFVPEMLVAAKAMKNGVVVLKPYLSSGESGAAGKVIIGTVAGDLHDIGKNLVAMMLESSGFEVIDLGVDVAKEKFVEAFEENPDTKIICCSALLTTTMPALRDTVALLNTLPERSRIKVMVGGAPINAEFAEEIGADAYTEDAASCAQKAKELTAA